MNVHSSHSYSVSPTQLLHNIRFIRWQFESRDQLHCISRKRRMNKLRTTLKTGCCDRRHDGCHRHLSWCCQLLQLLLLAMTSADNEFWSVSSAAVVWRCHRCHIIVRLSVPDHAATLDRAGGRALSIPVTGSQLTFPTPLDAEVRLPVVDLRSHKNKSCQQKV